MIESASTRFYRNQAGARIRSLQHNQGIYFQKAAATYMVEWYLSKRRDEKRQITLRLSTMVPMRQIAA